LKIHLDKGDYIMKGVPEKIERFLGGKDIAVAGVSRNGDVAANAVFKKLKNAGYNVVPINPNASEIDGIPSYPDLSSVPNKVHGVVIATHPDISAEIVRQCGDCGIKHVWFHRSFGQGSVSDEAVQVCSEIGIDPIVGGCPLMFCEPVDIVHKCMKWWLQKTDAVS
jgi:predicted CoA-binding protein